MSKSATASELTVPVEILAPVSRETQNGYSKTFYENVYGEKKRVWCKWVNAHGNDTLAGLQLGLHDPATLTLRYADKLTPVCRIRRISDGAVYRVISVDNVGERGCWMEVKVERLVKAV